MDKKKPDNVKKSLRIRLGRLLRKTIFKFRTKASEKNKKVTRRIRIPSSDRLVHGIRRTFDGQTSRLYSLFDDFKPTLTQSGLRRGFKTYVNQLLSLFILSTVGSSVFFFVLVSVIPSSGLVSNPLFRPFMFIVLPVAIGLITFYIAYMYPSILKSRRRERIEAFLPYTANYMAVLACAGVSPERILHSTAVKDPKYLLSDEVKQIVGKMDMLGYDIISAINSEINRSPSASYSNLLRGFAATTRSGGNLKKFLLGATRLLMRNKSVKLREFMDTLSMLGEAYVALLIVFPLFLIIMFSMMATVGGSIMGMDILQLMYFVTFGLIPMLGIIFLLALDMLQPKG